MPMTDQEAASFLGIGAGGDQQPAMGKFSDDQAASFLKPATDALAAYRAAAVTPDIPTSTPEGDAALAQSGVGRVLDAFGQGAKNGWGSSPLGLDPTTESSLRKVGLLNDTQNQQINLGRAFGEAFIRPAATALDAASRIPGAIIGAAQAGVAQAGVETGQPGLGRDIAALPEAFPFGFHEGVPGEPAAPRQPSAPPLLEEARQHGIIGADDRTWQGYTEPPRPPPASNDNLRLAERPTEPPAAAAEAVPPAEPAVTAPPKDVHELARRIAPDTFNEYDALTDHRDGLRQQIADAQTDLRRQAEAQAPHAAEIADLQARMEDTTPRLAKKYQARLDAMIPERDAFLGDDFTIGALTRDTPEISALRQQLMETDYRMRDLAPDVSAAYRDASAQMPVDHRQEISPSDSQVSNLPADLPAEELTRSPPSAETTASPEQPVKQDVDSAPESKAPAQGEPGRSVPVAAAADQPAELRPLEVAARSVPASIADDVSQKLQAAGRPTEEAQAAGQVTQALWDTRAARFEGKKGTAQEMYAREAPDIRAGRAPARGRATDAPSVQTLTRASLEARSATGRAGGEISADAMADGFHRPIAEAVARGDQVVHVSSEGRETPLTSRNGQTVQASDGAGVGWMGMLSRTGDRVEMRGRAREMAQGTTRNGRIDLTNDGRSVITLMRTANASTYLHEMGHDWLERTMRDAADRDAPAQLRQDAETVRSYLRVNEGDQIPTAAHEKFARSFERYFMEGRAPTQALAGVFGQFKDWLTRIYQTVSNLRAPITSDIRDVFDRLLATDPDGFPGDKPSIVPEAAREQGELPIGGTMEPSKPTPLFPKPPKEPMRLISFLRKSGGLRDEGGEISNMLGGPKARPGLINSTGMSLDEALIKAHEAGYFPEHGDDLPDARAFLDAIESDLRGEPRYSAEDQVAAAAYRAVADHNAEVDRLAQDHDIDTRGMTREQFFEALSERVSRERQVAEMRSMDEAHAAEYDEAIHDARDWLEDHGHDWDSHEFFGSTDKPTQELEHEYAAQNAARATSEQLPGGGEPGPSAGSEGQVQSGGGQGGRDPGNAGRAGQASEPAAGNDPVVDQPAARVGADAGSAPSKPTRPADAFGNTSGDLVDKAGNIRLDNLTTPEDVRSAIRQTAAENGDFTTQRRGVVTDADTLQLADDLGMTPGDLQSWRIGQTFNAEQIVALRKLLRQSAQDLVEAAGKAVNDEGAVAAYAEARQRHVMIQGVVSGVTAEAGRALRAFRALPGESDMRSLGDMLQQNTGRTLFQLQQEAKALTLLDDPAQVTKFVREAAKPSLSDKLFEVFVNGLISNPITHKAYAEANLLFALWKAAPERAVAGAIGAVRHMLGGEDERVFMGEVGAELYGMASGQIDGIKAAWRAAKSGITQELPGEGAAQLSMLARPGATGAIPGMAGTIIRAPGERMVAPIHSYFRSIGYSQSIAGLAYRQASAEGLSGAAFSARLADLKMNPSEAMMDQARAAATSQTLMSRGGPATQAVGDFVRKFPGLRWIDPFVKISSNIFGEALKERSPIGLAFPDVRDNLMGRNGGVARDEQISRIAVGSAVGMSAYWLASQGLMSGGGPEDPHERAIWQLSGNQPYSVRIGDNWYQYSRLGVLGKLLGLASDAFDVREHLGEEDQSKVATSIVGSLAHALIDDSFMKGPADLFQAMLSPQQYETSYIAQWFNALTPFSAAVRQLDRVIDPQVREARSVLDKVKQSLPGLSETLSPRYDLWGQPKRIAAFEPVTSIYTSRITNDPVTAALVRLQDWKAMPPQQIRGVRLSDDQYAEYTRLAGRWAHDRLTPIVSNPNFGMLPEGAQKELIDKTITQSREQAAVVVQMHNPGLIQQAVENKRAIAMTGHKPTP